MVKKPYSIIIVRARAKPEREHLLHADESWCSRGCKSAAKWVVLRNYSTDFQSKHTNGKLLKIQYLIFNQLYRKFRTVFRLNAKNRKFAKICAAKWVVLCNYSTDFQSKHTNEKLLKIQYLVFKQLYRKFRTVFRLYAKNRKLTKISAAKWVVLCNYSTDFQSKHTNGKLLKIKYLLIKQFYRKFGIVFRLCEKNGNWPKVQQSTKFSEAAIWLFYLNNSFQTPLKMRPSVSYDILKIGQSSL